MSGFLRRWRARRALVRTVCDLNELIDAGWWVDEISPLVERAAS